MSSNGPLGRLAGMTYDPIKKRYFPTPPASASASNARSAPVPEAGPSRPRVELPRKRLKSDGKSKRSPAPAPAAGPGEGIEVLDRPCAFITGKTRRLPLSHGRPRGIHSKLVPPNHIGRATEVSRAQATTNYYSNLQWSDVVEVGSTECESITQLRQCPTGAFHATTDHGRVVMQGVGRDMQAFSLCGNPMLGMHLNIPRMSALGIMSGAYPHIHRYRRSSDNPEAGFASDCLEVETENMLCMSSYGDLCTIGMTRKLMTVRDDSPILDQGTFSRPVPSDPLAVHHATEHLVYAGLRNGSLIVDDQRTRAGRSQKIGKTTRGKAVVGIKRLQDSAVPYGLVASGMMNELLLYDVRYGQEPVRAFQGHINLHNSDLGMTTTSDDQYLFAAGSDKRIRAWSTRSGERLQPSNTDPAIVSPFSTNPLTRIFRARPVGIEITESGLMAVASGSGVHRFMGPTGTRYFPQGNDLADLAGMRRDGSQWGGRGQDFESMFADDDSGYEDDR